MKPRERLTLAWLFLSFFLAASLACSVFYVYIQLTLEQQVQLIEILYPFRFYLLIPIITLLGLLIYGAKWVLEQLWLPIAQLTDEVQILFNSRTGNRLKTVVPPHLQHLANLLNDHSRNMESLQKGVDDQIAEAKKELEYEKNVFAAMIEELREGIVVCNSDASILLYNKAAQDLFATSELKPGVDKNSDSRLGLGRSFKAILPTPRLKYTLNELQERQRIGNHNLVQHFSTWFGSRLIRVQTIGILNNENELNGFIFNCEDLSQSAKDYHPQEILGKINDEKKRAGIANIRSAIETMLDYPEMPPEKQQKLMNSIREQSVKLSELLEKKPKHNKEELRVLCPLEQTPIQEWLQTIETNSARPLELKYVIADTQVKWFVQLNRYFFSQVLEFLFRQLHQTLNLDLLEIKLDRKNQFVLMDICWQGKELSPDVFREWLSHSVSGISDEQTVEISEILLQHDAEIWIEEIPNSNQNGLRLFLPGVESLDSVYAATKHINIGSRPIFYDFDLFHKTSFSEKWGEVALIDATYTVFDTETTGLDPAGGDEIISIGAIRIVNGKLLRNETFSQLVNPQCKISQESFQVHGISTEQLKDQPVINKVLPFFHRFAEDSILVGHNAAFDMRFLQLKESASNIVFDNPVLDTLLLSSVINANQDRHDLDSVSKRFGIEFNNRHSAIGDAIVTAEILLQILPLLESQGILTVKDALSASQKSYYAGVKY